MYSLGIILFELFYPFGTDMERVKEISDLRQAKLPQALTESHPDKVWRVSGLRANCWVF